MTTASRWHVPARALEVVVVLCLTAGVLGRSVAAPDTDEHAAAPATPTTQQTEQGAVDAALGILALYGSTAMYDASGRRDLVGRTAAAEVEDALQAQLDVAFALTARGLGIDARGRSADGTLVARMIPAGYRVVSWSLDRAVVAVWTTGLLGVAGARSRNPVQEHWSTETVTLVWEASEWRWVGLDHQDGPAPVGSPQVPAPADQIALAQRDFAEVGHVR